MSVIFLFFTVYNTMFIEVNQNFVSKLTLTLDIRDDMQHSM